MKNNIRLDAHIHLGECFCSERSRNKPLIYASPEDVKQYIEKEELTHAVIFYSKTDELNQLRNLVPEVKIYPVSWITDFSQIPNEGDIGVKVHSSRGKNSKDEYGIDYTSLKLQHYLKKLPDGLKVFLHTQGSTDCTNTARPLVVGLLASKFPNLQFIICHAGSYGLHSYYPSEYNATHYYTAVVHELLVKEAVHIAERYDNVKIDSSILITKNHYKSKLLMEHGEFLTASDFPFCRESSLVSIKNQERIMKQMEPDIDLQQFHIRNINFLEN